MFGGCAAFNQSVSNWDVSKVKYMNNMFNNCTLFNNGTSTGYLFDPEFGGKAPTSELTTTAQMFQDCTSFNQSVSNWDVSNVTTMRAMFNGCTIYNYPLNTWILSKNLQSDGMINLFFSSALTQTNLNRTLIAWRDQYKSSSSTFPTGVSLTNLPVSPSDDGLTAKNNLKSGPGWTIT
jgi:surface protein